MFRPICLLLPIVLTSCVANAPPKTIRLPPAISEASGLSISGNEFTWHNDSGDGPVLYTTNERGQLLRQQTLPAEAVDNEDLARDAAGNLYLGDFGNNTGKRTQQQIYRCQPASGQTDTIRFTYPGQDGRGRAYPGNHDCEAMVYLNGELHLFTKDQLRGKGRFYTYHYRVPAVAGTYVAELLDSLYLPRRVVTAAAIDPASRELLLTAYNFKLLLGFWPSSAASLITIKDYPADRLLRGKLTRRNLSWFIPTQFEAVDLYDEKWLYVASEGTRIRKYAVAKRKRRR